LQEKEFERVGSSQTLRVDVRVIAATNRNLEEAIQKGTFREDLYYRLNVVTLSLPRFETARRTSPPGRAFPEKVQPGKSEDSHVPIQGGQGSSDGLFLSREYPGIGEHPRTGRGPLPERDGHHPGPAPEPEGEQSRGPDEGCGRGRSLPETLEEIERLRITQALERSHGVQTQAAEELGISERVLRYKMKKYGIGEKE